VKGGLVTTNNFNFFKKIKEQRSHGIIRDNNKHWKYEINETSLNYRISEINCLLGLSQIKKTKKFLSKRHMLAKIYNKNLVAKSNILKAIDITNPDLSAWHLYIILIDFKKLKISKDKFIDSLLKKRIVIQQHYIPIYRVLGMKVKKQANYPNSEKYFKTALSLPLFIDLTISQQKYIINKLQKILNYAVIKKRSR
jgi:dTDP-4-amino-4,6-dideoxygalactose transaminase